LLLSTKVLAVRIFSVVLATLLLLLACTSAASAKSPNRWITGKTWNIAHQGGEDEFPSNTMYAFKRSLKAGADMLELDIGVTKDNQVIVMHDTTVDRVTNGKGLVSEMTLKQIQKLDGAYWFSRGENAYRHDRKKSSYRFRGVALGKRKAPKGFKASDFRVTTLKQVLKAFPKTPINIEIKGRTKAEEISEYVKNAEVLARLLKKSKRKDLIVVSFKQDAVNRFHELAPKIDTAPGLEGSAAFLLSSVPVPAGSAALQLPVTYRLDGTLLEVGSEALIKTAHDSNLAWHSWFGNEDSDSAASWKLLTSRCADGIMTAKPTALERVLRKYQRAKSCPR
jgi:glycerophosphoryl diester phosphodiesterase